MSLKQLLITILCLLSVGSVGASSVSACQCFERQPLLTEFDTTATIVTVKITAVQESNDRYAINGLKSVTAVVNKSFKGKLKAGNELRFAQGGGADCIWEFAENSAGQGFLFFLGEKPGEAGLWYVSFCGRSSTLANAADDLLYLENLNRLRGRTRVSGTVDFNDDEELRSGRIKIRLRGERKTYETHTDPHGVYEIYDLPAGKYLVEPEMPRGWTVFWPKKYDDPYQLPEEKEDPPPPENQVVVLEKKHAELNFSLNPNNGIEGKVVGPDGRPVEGASVSAVFADDPKPRDSFPDLTRSNGEFYLSSLRPGRYFVVVNLVGRVSAEQPYATSYYPNVLDRSQALSVDIGVGETIKDLTITIPRFEEVVTISGVVQYANGQPVDDCLVEFRAAGQRRPYHEYPTEDDTDEQGRFTIQIVKGSGTITGIIRGGEEDYADCPDLRSKLKHLDNEWIELLTETIVIGPDTTVENLVLRFPFLRCKKVTD